MESYLSIASVAFKNLTRKPARTVLLLLSVAVVVGILFPASLFISGMENGLTKGVSRLGADVLVVPKEYAPETRSALLAGEPTSFTMDKSVIDRIRNIEGVRRASPQLFVKPAPFTCCYDVDVFLLAFDPDTDFTVQPWLAGALRRALSKDEIITGSEVPVMPGDAIPFFGTPFRVTGTMEPTGMPFFDRSVFMTMEAAYAMSDNSRRLSEQPLDVARGTISAVLIQTHKGHSPDSLAIRIEHEIKEVKAIPTDEIISTVKGQLNGLFKGVLTIGTVLWVLALLLMGFAFSVIANERRREFGLLRSMGAKQRHVFRLIVYEALLMSAAGGLMGLMAGAVLLASFKTLIMRTIGLPYLLPSGSVLTVIATGALAFSLLTGLLSSLLPAVAARRMEPYAAIRGGE